MEPLPYTVFIDSEILSDFIGLVVIGLHSHLHSKLHSIFFMVSMLRLHGTFTPKNQGKQFTFYLKGWFLLTSVYSFRVSSRPVILQ